MKRPVAAPPVVVLAGLSAAPLQAPAADCFVFIEVRRFGLWLRFSCLYAADRLSFYMTKINSHASRQGYFRLETGSLRDRL